MLRKIIEKSRRIVFFGGAGVSTASGIPDFRSPEGLYAGDFDGLTPEQAENRRLLRELMTRCGFLPLEAEWWHFRLKDEPFPDTYFNFPQLLNAYSHISVTLSGNVICVSASQPENAPPPMAVTPAGIS